MSKKKVVIQFKNIFRLWQFAQSIKATSMEIRTNEFLLICNCSAEDLELLQKYGGEIRPLPEGINV